MGPCRLEGLLEKSCSQDPSHPLVPYASRLVHNRETVFPNSFSAQRNEGPWESMLLLQSPHLSAFLITFDN